MKKLSQSHASKKHLENKFGVKSEPISKEVQDSLAEVSTIANEKIAKNNSVYDSSNSRSHLYPTNSNGDCILATDFRKLDQEMKAWKDARESKIKLYQAFSEYILCLESQLEHEDDSYKKYLIQKEIKELKKEQQKYYVPSMLEMALYVRKDKDESKNTLEKSSFSLIKKIIKK